MSAIRGHLEDYLALRRSLGFRLRRPGQMLEELVGYLEQAGAQTVTAGHALAWATAPAGADPVYWRKRLSAARPFARYLAPRVPGTEVPPPGLLPGPSSRRAVPYLYSGQEVAALMAAAGEIRTPFRAANELTWMSVGLMDGYSAIGNRVNVNTPTIVMTMEITMATIGRRMKN